MSGFSAVSSYGKKFEQEKKKFIERAVREQEKRDSFPPGWVGTWRDVYGPRGERVYFSTSARVWMFAWRGNPISRHNNRDGAFTKAKKYLR